MKVKYCPKCGSSDVSIPTSSGDLTVVLPDYCKDCGYIAVFPEVDEDNLDEIRYNILHNDDDDSFVHDDVDDDEDF